MARPQTLIVAALVASVVGAVRAGADGSPRVTGSVANELDSAYIYNGAVYSDAPIWTVYPEVDIHLDDRWFVGVWSWFLSDLTRRRHEAGVRRAWNECDYGVFLAGTLWETGADADRLALETSLGYEWMTYSYYSSIHYPEFSARFVNPWITPYIKGFYEIRQLKTLRLEFGLEKSIPLAPLADALQDVALDLRLSAHGGHRRVIACNWGVAPDHAGLASLEGRAGLSWTPWTHLRLRAFVDYLGVVNDNLEDRLHRNPDVPRYVSHPQIVWFGLSAMLSF